MSQSLDLDFLNRNIHNFSFMKYRHGIKPFICSDFGSSKTGPDECLALRDFFVEHRDDREVNDN